MGLRAVLACIVLICMLAPGLGQASSQLAALDLGFTAFTPSTARDVNAAGQVYVEGLTDPQGNLPRRAIFMPPHPGGSVLTFACYPVCDPCATLPPPCGLAVLFTVWDRPAGLTETGQFFGARYHIQLPQSTYPTPASWSPSAYTIQDFAPAPGGSSAYGFVRDMNASGASVGGVIVPALGPLIAIPFIWSSPAATPVALANLGSSAGPQALRISDPGAIVGGLLGATPRAVYWPAYSAASFSYLGELPGGVTSHAKDLDDSGRVVGSSDDGSGAQVAALWRPSGGGHAVAALPIPFAGGSCQEATAIAESGGLIAGNCTTAAGDRRGVIWRDVGASVVFLQELLPISGDDDSLVYGLGGSVLAAGSSGDPARAVLWNLAPVPAVPALSPLAISVLVAALLVSWVIAARGRSFGPPLWRGR